MKIPLLKFWQTAVIVVVVIAAAAAFLYLSKPERTVQIGAYDARLGNAVFSDRGYMVVNASFEAPDPCRDVLLITSLKDYDLKVIYRLIPSRLSEGCIRQVSRIGRSVRYGPLPKGAYTVNVVADYPDANWAPKTFGEVRVTIS
ncbi:MAG TPA: hypothetical protein HA254_04115 [Candidatus Diapherotrites archaeon]|uniref:Uncharacterized protein n=1 Tax=Candidatus Iainarchaeum sp. TaxID=3101447 RepID=A0A7J4J000_9ARCH|nr:hypothetical protein [Candidatus Diapherotrites archaeon]